MKATKKHIELIQQRFSSLSSKEDLLLLINEANKMMYGEDAFTVKLGALTYFANPSTCKKRYTAFKVAKKSGGARTINAPVNGLKNILKALNFIFQCITGISSRYIGKHSEVVRV